tara:strand:+ start:265 stop:369 length:105 start_codon:yes stop_codon:yes gene_type:complete
MLLTRVVQVVLLSGVLFGLVLTVKVFVDDMKEGR